jgi:phosphatidate phosphatase PAH1
VTIPGKFAYGRVSKDLEDEKVVLSLDACKEWASGNESITDDDGRTAFAIPADKNPGPGIYQLHQTMVGDGSYVSSRLTIAPTGSRIVVFDVDGTLTIGDDELKEQMKAEYLGELVSGKRVPKPYPDAGALTKAWRSKGYLVVYMTGRPYWLAGLTRSWLDQQGCAIGHLHTTDRSRDSRPTEGGVGEFKAAYLKELLAAGFSIDYVYGNAESDVFAYADAGISPAKTHIIGEFGGQGGTQAIAGGYTGHIKWVSEQPDAVQPFVVSAP